MSSRQCPDAVEAVLPNRSRQPPRPPLGNADGLCGHSLRFCQRGLEPLFPSFVGHVRHVRYLSQGTVCIWQQFLQHQRQPHRFSSVR